MKKKIPQPSILSSVCHFNQGRFLRRGPPSSSDPWQPPGGKDGLDFNCAFSVVFVDTRGGGCTFAKMCTRAQSFQTNIIVQSPTIVCFHHENKTYAIHRQQGDTFGFDAKVPYIYAFLACWELQSRSRKGKVV